jgi:hypothetical protein
MLLPQSFLPNAYVSMTVKVIIISVIMLLILKSCPRLPFNTQLYYGNYSLDDL